jgi:hypothetical protein
VSNAILFISALVLKTRAGEEALASLVLSLKPVIAACSLQCSRSKMTALAAVGPSLAQATQLSSQFVKLEEHGLDNRLLHLSECLVIERCLVRAPMCRGAKGCKWSMQTLNRAIVTHKAPTASPNARHNVQVNIQTTYSDSPSSSENEQLDIVHQRNLDNHPQALQGCTGGDKQTSPRGLPTTQWLRAVDVHHISRTGASPGASMRLLLTSLTGSEQDHT